MTNDTIIDLGILQECLSCKHIAFHCDTQWKAEQLLKALSLLGYTWNSGAELSDFDMWSVHDKKTCYGHTTYAQKIMFGSADWYISNSWEIVEFEAITSPIEHRDDDFLKFLEAKEI